MEFDITYIIATYNRLPFLKITLGKLLLEVQDNEEIVIVDGNSTDGAKEYLQELYNSGKIHQFISEPDNGQAHAWNKALLMANGTVIKKIIDDDVFCYDAIRKCKEHMLQNPQVDVIISNDLNSILSSNAVIQQNSRQLQFEQWRSGTVPSFTFSDVHMLIRRTSLAYIGLYNPSFTMLDWEYALRISYLKANICYYTGYNALSVIHPQTVSSTKNDELIKEQGKRAGVFYEYAGDAADISNWSKIKISVGKLIYRDKQPSGDMDTTPIIGDIYNEYYKHINKLNQSGNFMFLASK